MRRVGILLGTFLWPLGARADSIDVGWLVFKVNFLREGPLRGVALAVLLLAVNLALNVLVITAPACRAVGRPLAGSWGPTVGYTLLAQVVDRMACVIALPLGVWVAFGTGLRGEGGMGAGAMIGLAFNLLLAGLGVGLLARWFVIRHLGLPREAARPIAIRAAVWTNPAWLMFLYFALAREV